LTENPATRLAYWWIAVLSVTVEEPMTQSLSEPLIEAVETVVTDATGAQALDLEILRSDEQYWIVSVGTAACEQLIVKLASSANVPSFEAAKAKHDLIRDAADVPMAEMIAADDSASKVPFRYSIQTSLSG
jgi:hypothetical protein